MALVVSVLPFLSPLLGLVLGTWGLRRTSYGGRRGRRLAVVAVVLSSLWITCVVGALVVVLVQPA